MLRKSSYILATLVIVSVFLIVQQVSGQYQASSGLSPITYLTDDQRRDILQQLMARKNDYRSTDASAIPLSDQSTEYATIMAQKRVIQDQLLSNQVQNQGYQAFDQNAVTEAINPQDLQITEAIDPSQQRRSLSDAITQHDSMYYGYQQDGTDQTAQYAQIQNQGFQQQQALTADQGSDQTSRFVQIYQSNMNKKPEDVPVGIYPSVDPAADARSTGVTPAIIPNPQQQYGQSLGSSLFGQQAVLDTDETALYASIESDKNARRLALEEPVRQDADSFSSIQNVNQRSLQQDFGGYDQSNLYGEIMSQKAATQRQLEQPVDQPIMEAPGLSPAIDPTQPQQQSSSQIRSWDVLNATPYYIPQHQQTSNWQSYNTDTRSFSALNTQQQDQTSDYLAIMAQQRAYQQALQQQQY